MRRRHSVCLEQLKNIDGAKSVAGVEQCIDAATTAACDPILNTEVDSYYAYVRMGGNVVSAANKIPVLKFPDNTEQEENSTEGHAVQKALCLTTHPRFTDCAIPRFAYHLHDGCFHGQIALKIPTRETLRHAVDDNPSSRVVLASALGGAVVGGATGAGTCGVIGGSIGTLCGLPLAPLTFGVSIVVGASMGGSTGACVGTAAGESVGSISGGLIGYGGYQLHSKVFDRTKQDMSNSDEVGIVEALWVGG